MAVLKNYKYEEFARQIAAGTDPVQAYELAGFKRNRANWRRLKLKPLVSARIEELKQEREVAARAARVPADEVLAELDRRGLDQITDLFDRNEAGILNVRDLQNVPVEVAIAFLRLLREGFGIKVGLS